VDHLNKRRRGSPTRHATGNYPINNIFNWHSRSELLYRCCSYVLFALSFYCGRARLQTPAEPSGDVRSRSCTHHPHRSAAIDIRLLKMYRTVAAAHATASIRALVSVSHSCGEGS